MGSNLGDNAANLLHDAPHDDPTSKASFFSRIASPFRSRSRNLPDFHVRLKEPHRQYSAGDRVQGSVVLSVIKPFRITHLTVALHGHVCAFKNAGATARALPFTSTLTPHAGHSFRYHGNGHASLFHDEIVLCGEGRLQPSKWEFQFDLQFPDIELPSSIDFERGIIAYMVTATLTRPTSIMPTVNCEARVALVEKVDVGLITPPRERKVFLQTMKRRHGKRKHLQSTVALTSSRQPPSTEAIDALSDRDSARATESSNESVRNLSNLTSGNLDDSTVQRSSVGVGVDVQSELSGESNNSNSHSGRGADGSGESHSGSRYSIHEEREITATVELLKGGCLPGDLVPVRIKVEHNRYMKSLHGIIVTLYRQGRVDYAPPLSSFKGLSPEDAQKLEPDEYYPKSKTGLGGLSLTSAGSCSVFRKDLSQAVAPLIIDPSTLTATITTAVRVPEDAFPSIRNVPGALITFRYYIEVVVDLGGKLARSSAGLAQPQQPTRMNTNSSVHGTYGIDLNLLANWKGSIVDTDHIRREKGVISVVFETVVGTTDRSRAQDKNVTGAAVESQAPAGGETYEGDTHDHFDWQNEYDGDHYYEGDFEAVEDQAIQEHGTQPPTSDTLFRDFQTPRGQAPVYVPPPEIPGDGDLTDKERARRAERQLLPSQPEPHPGTQSEPLEPSAPDVAVPSSSNLESHISIQDHTASAPPLQDVSGPGRERMDDKQELERRRLMAEASAPPEMPEDCQNGEASAPGSSRAQSSAQLAQEPSAPVLHEDDPYDDRGTNSRGPEAHSEPLPRYER
ncbi:hypothetical protein F5Y18DRAFT_349536 [Xylariaceae sp. FL1019]|nr:hypothetical protein F5Y18DRAFT_349536 [Xylariaceae sp. FL1019]